MCLRTKSQCAFFELFFLKPERINQKTIEISQTDGGYLLQAKEGEPLFSIYTPEESPLAFQGNGYSSLMILCKPHSKRKDYSLLKFLGFKFDGKNKKIFYPSIKKLNQKIDELNSILPENSKIEWKLKLVYGEISEKNYVNMLHQKIIPISVNKDGTPNDLTIHDLTYHFSAVFYLNSSFNDFFNQYRNNNNLAFFFDILTGDLVATSKKSQKGFQFCTKTNHHS